MKSTLAGLKKSSIHCGLGASIPILTLICLSTSALALNSNMYQLPTFKCSVVVLKHGQLAESNAPPVDVVL